MSIRMRNEKWVVDFYPSGRAGRRVVRTLPAGTSMEDALAMENRLRNRVDSLQNTEGIVNTIFKRYLDFCKLHRTPKTFQDIEGSFKNHISPILGDFQVSALGKEQLEYYQTFRKKEGAHNGSTNKEIGSLGGFLSWAEKEKIIRDKPKVQKLPYARPFPVILTPDEALQIIDNLEQPYRAFVCGFYFEALRIGDDRDLQWENVNFASNTIQVIQKGGTWKIIRMSERFRKELLEIMPEKPTGLVFRSVVTGRQIIDPRKALARAKAKTGITKRIYPHLFRHSICTYAMASGVNHMLVQGFMGHKSFDSTQWYTHLVPEQLKPVTDAIDIFTNGPKLLPETVTTV
jgi:integrase/recombinase XerD